MPRPTLVIRLDSYLSPNFTCVKHSSIGSSRLSLPNYIPHIEMCLAMILRNGLLPSRDLQRLSLLSISGRKPDDHTYPFPATELIVSERRVYISTQRPHRNYLGSQRPSCTPSATHSDAIAASHNFRLQVCTPWSTSDPSWNGCKLQTGLTRSTCKAQQLYSGMFVLLSCSTCGTCKGIRLSVSVGSLALSARGRLGGSNAWQPWILNDLAAQWWAPPEYSRSFWRCLAIYQLPLMSGPTVAATSLNSRLWSISWLAFWPRRRRKPFSSAAQLRCWLGLPIPLLKSSEGIYRSLLSV